MPSSYLTELFDAHAHADFFAEGAHAPCLCATVSPARWLDARERSEAAALGLHPWWIAAGVCGDEDVGAFVRQAPETSLIGEVGLDFYGSYAESAPAQLAAFERICAALADGKRRYVTMHARRAERELLDIVERCGLTASSVCCLHGFSGSSDELHRAADLGLWFSVSARTLSAKKWREYLKVVPRERLLLETDFPPACILPAAEDSLATAAPLSPSRMVDLEAHAHARALEEALALLGPGMRGQIVENQRAAFRGILV